MAGMMLAAATQRKESTSFHGDKARNLMSRTIQQFGKILLSQAATSIRREKRSYSRMPGGCIDFKNLE
jgi:hypothetical protein